MASLDNIIETTDHTNGLVRSAWLVGLGIYAKGLERVQNQVGHINGSKFCLVRKLVPQCKKHTLDAKESITADVRKEITIDKRVLETRKRLGLDVSNTDAKVSELSKKVDELAEILIKLS